MCADDLADGAAGSSHPDASMVVVHVPASAVGLAADIEQTDGNATIDGEPIVPAAVERLLCDTRIEFHVDDPDGRTVGIGRAARNPPPWLRRRVLHRDGHRCRWPGCNRPIRHLHHMQHWMSDGPTDASNLLGVCLHHHHLLHEGCWKARGNADGHITLIGPHGRTIDSRAGPVAA